MPASRCAPKSYRTRKVQRRGHATYLLFCCPRGKWQPRKKRCSVGMRLDKITRKSRKAR
jgi:hypothetical protein